MNMNHQTENQTKTKAEKNPPHITTIPEYGFLRRSQVLSFLCESSTGFRRKIKAGLYPEGHTLPGGRTRVWRASDIRLLISLISDGKSWQDRDGQAADL